MSEDKKGGKDLVPIESLSEGARSLILVGTEMIQVRKHIRMQGIKNTSISDWIDQGDQPYLKSDASFGIGAAFNLTIKNREWLPVEIINHEDATCVAYGQPNKDKNHIGKIFIEIPE